MVDENTDLESGGDEGRAAPEPAVLLEQKWGLGYAALGLLGVLTATGLLLMLRYRPDPAFAWSDVFDLRQMSGWRALHELHFWAARGVLVLMAAHLLDRVLRRRFDGWISGVVLLALLAGWSWSGDALAVRPSSVEGAGVDTLLWIYVLHVAIFPLLVALLLALHARARRQTTGGEGS